MYQHKTSYKSLADYDLDMMLLKRKKLAEVQSVLSLYDRNNQHLVDQVHHLIQQNQSLKNQIKNNSPKRLNKSSFAHKNSISQVNSYLQTQKTTLKKQKSSRYLNKFSHPRNAYMAPLQVQMLNRKMQQQAKTAQKKYDLSKGYENFKQKLTERKQQLKNSYKSKSNFKNSQISMTKSPYIEEPSLQILKRQPLNQINRLNINIPHQKQSRVYEKREPSPYQNLQKSAIYQSPEKFQSQARNKRQDTQRSSSAIKIQNSYPSMSIRIPEPKTKWGDLSSTYFEKSKLIKNDQKTKPFNQRQEVSERGQKSRTSKKRKFLNVISQSIDVKLILKGQI